MIGTVIRCSELQFLQYEMRITVLVTVNIDCVTLNYEFVIGTNGRSFEHWNDVIRIRLKRTIWAALGEPIFKDQDKHGENWWKVVAVDQ